MSNKQYHFVWEYLEPSEGNKGRLYMTSLDCKKHFDALTPAELVNRNVKIIEHGITKERAFELCAKANGIIK